MTLQEFYSDESKWCKQQAYNLKDPSGFFEECNVERACLLQATDLLPDAYEIRAKIRKYLQEVCGCQPVPPPFLVSIILWNDDPQRKFGDIRKLVEDLDI